ncbi:MAG: lysine--tRNA ligase [Candidatus Pacebacteria bacterium]|nr:lysine--tRNA ligase [Candidatus Paceibacterota bacterium]
MSALDDIRAERVKKLELLRSKGIDPYPIDSTRTHELVAVRRDFSALESSGESVTVSGRIMSLRGQGGIIFADLFDGTDRMQVVIKKESVGDDAFDLFEATIDSSDFIDVTGTAFTTKRGEQSVLTTTWRIIAKSLRPVPSEWFGIKDEDERFRKRYLDILLTQDVQKVAGLRSAFWNAARSYMLERNFVEVETPVLETLTGGAEARPFVTHHHALDLDVYLRISAGELWQKKLLVAGIPRTFEIGRIFRNEGISAEHAQDYTQFEFYAAYMDASVGVPMLIDMYRTIAQKTFGTTQFTIRGFTIDLAAPWAELDYSTLMQDAYGFDPKATELDTVLAVMQKENIPIEPNIELGRAVDQLWKKVRKTISGPAILTGMPLYLEPLAKKSADPRTVERYQILIAGSEVGKAFNELNDPIDQAERFSAQQALRDKGDDEAQMADFDYVEALEYGMPPAFGFGVSERLFSFLIDKPIREAQLFPLMRPRDAVPQKGKTMIAVAVINTAGLEPWQVVNTAAHLSAELGARQGKSLFKQDTVATKDGAQIPLNIQHAIIIKTAKSSEELKNLLGTAQTAHVHTAAFTRHMLETTNDKKISDATGQTNFADIDMLGVLVFGEKEHVQKITEHFTLFS